MSAVKMQTPSYWKVQFSLHSSGLTLHSLITKVQNEAVSATRAEYNCTVVECAAGLLLSARIAKANRLQCYCETREQLCDFCLARLALGEK